MSRKSRLISSRIVQAALYGVESLERRLFLSTARGNVQPFIAGSITGGVLNVNGTSGDDSITVSTDGTLTTVTLNGTPETFNNGDYTAVSIFGDAGNDSIALSGGVIGSTINGGPGNDTLAGDTGADTFIGGGDVDAVTYANRSENLKLVADGVTPSGANGGAEGDLIGADISNIVGGAGNDIITGNALGNTLFAGAGSNTLNGLGGSDTLFGNNGSPDTLDGGAGTDSEVGDAGVDTFINVELGADLSPAIAITDSGTAVPVGGSVNFGSVTVGATPPQQTFTVNNGGNGTLALGTLTLPAGFSLVNASATSVAPGGSTTFTVQMETDTAASNSGLLKLANNVAGFNPYSFTINGNVTAALVPAIAISTGRTAIPNGGSANFGSSPAGAAAPQLTFTIANTGTANLTVGALSVPGGFALVSGPASSVAPGGNTAFTVQMNTDSVGGKTGVLSIANNVSGSNPYQITLNGTVTVPLVPGITVSDGGTTVPVGGSVNFGSPTVGNAAPQHTFTVTNNGTATLALGAITLPAGFSLVDTPSASVAPGASTTFTVQLDTDTAGNKTGTLRLVDNVAGFNPYQFTLVGSVNVPLVPTITVLYRGVALPNGSSTPVNFGAVVAGGASVNLGFTIRNDGTANLSVGAINVPTGYTLVSGPAGTISPGGSTSFVVGLVASNAGTKLGNITFTDNDSTNSSFAIPVTGIVTAPKLTVLQGATIIPNNSASAIDFGNVVQGGPGSTQSFVVRNDGNAFLSLAGLTVPAGYAIVTGQAATVAPGATTSFTIRLQSSVLGTAAGRITFTDNDLTNSTFALNVTGIVVPAPTPQIAVSQVLRGTLNTVVNGSSTPIDFGTVVLGQRSPTQTFHIRNSGTATLTVGRLSIPTGFSVVTALPASIAIGTSADLVIALGNTSAGSPGGQVSFATNDNGANPFSFNVAGRVILPTPSIGVGLVQRRRGVGAIPPAAARPISFGSLVQGSRTPVQTFAISNSGLAALSIGRVLLPSGYSFVTYPARSVAPGASTTFSIRMSTANPGTFSGSIQLITNDPQQSNYTITVVGLVTAVPFVGVTGNLNAGVLTITGTEGDDVIVAQPVSRSIQVVGDGRVVGVFSGVSKIIINGGSGNDLISTVRIGINSTLNGDDGNDTLLAGSGNDVLDGGSGDDSLDAGAGNDELLGDDGNDHLVGGLGVDAMKGGNGNDFLDATDGAADSLVDGGPGSDVIHRDRLDPWTGT